MKTNNEKQIEKTNSQKMSAKENKIGAIKVDMRYQMMRMNNQNRRSHGVMLLF
ncbi:MAG: hypothetical protein KAS62_02735 [Candidatus Delongbacteria bacterium]|nr:hypothetical protein [Candidatus Delongbacteria bacterium]